MPKYFASSSCNRVTVYITTRDRRLLLQRALTSVFSQSHPPDEVIVVDDGSRDDTAAFLDSSVVEHNNLKVLRNKKPLGACVSRNLAINHASGGFITGLDDDDTFHEDRVAVFLSNSAALDEGYSALSSNLDIQRKKHKIRRTFALESITLDDLLLKNYVGNQVFTKTARLRAIGGFDPAFPAMQDYDTWVRLVDRFGPVKRLSDATYTVHMNHDAPRLSTSDNRTRAADLFYQKHRQLLNKTHLKAAQIHKRICSGKPASLSFCSSNYVPALTQEIVRYFFQSNFPILRQAKERLFH